MNKREANQRIADLISQATKLVREAEEIADEAGVSFQMNISGAYGGGATYTGAEAVDEWERSEYEIEEGVGFWRSSSQSC